MSAPANLFREAARHFITSVALITSTGSHGPNVMSAEWTFNVSYNPMRIIVFIHPGLATFENIVETKEFGANFVSEDQSNLANLAGAYHGGEVNKLSSEIFQTYPAVKSQVPMILGCFLNAECRLINIVETGDHTMFLGDVLEIRFDASKNPLLYGQRKYWQRGSIVVKKPSIYLTCTVRRDQTRLDGRLLGMERYPQIVTLRLRREGFSLWEEETQTDEYGYFELIRTSNAEPQRGSYLAEASWNDLTGKASAKIQ